MNTKIMCLIIALVSIVVLATCGCVNNDCSEMLPIRELFGAKFDEPWGGKLELNDLGRGGADDVSEKPKSGRYCHEYTWQKGCQVIRLSLWYDDSKEGYDGSVMLDVFRTDMGVNPVE